MNILAFGVPGPTDWMVILIIVLVLFGAKKVPELFRGMAQGVNEFRKAREEFEKEMHSAGNEVKQAANMTSPTQPTQPYQPAQNTAQPYQPSPTYPQQPVAPGVQPTVATAPVYQQAPTQQQPQQPGVQPQPDKPENPPA
jgi:sec-independent protein translocase protein TatA